jgi:thiol-disulfide isomerase/thioredoxin
MSQLASNRALGDATLQLVAKMSVADAPLAKFLESDEIHLREMENRPFSIDGVTSDGSHISTGDWKGQVVLVDFWASCCGPCLAETSRIQSLLKEYSGQGLRVLGICFDDRAEMARHAFSINCDLNWPSIPDQQLSNGNTAISISQRLGVNRFPTVFLIDRKGVLRDVDAHGDLEQAIARYCGRIPENEMGGRGR